jgi:hypothetical protein
MLIIFCYVIFFLERLVFFKTYMSFRTVEVQRPKKNKEWCEPYLLTERAYTQESQNP